MTEPTPPLHPYLATAPYQGVSAKYSFIPTTSVVKILEEAGWLLRTAQSTAVRREDKRGFQKHLLRFQNPALGGGGSLRPEILFLNDHSATSSARLMAGFFVSACANGLIVAQEGLEDIRVLHLGTALDSVLSALTELLTRLPSILEALTHFKTLEMNSLDSFTFSDEALKIRWPNPDGQALQPIFTHDIQSIRRQEDRGRSLWLHYQRAQENLLKGGMQGRRSDGHPLTIRPIKSISETIRINKELWLLTEKWALALSQP
jgi:Domain of unknown function (DUF932)